jgi:TM2 domain-containing membrane protein YozV
VLFEKSVNQNQMNKEKQTYLLFVLGVLLIGGALHLNNNSNMPDLLKGLIFGIGIGLIGLFVMRRVRSNNAMIE